MPELGQLAVAYIALGANLGDPRATLRWAVRRLADLGHVDAVSRLYRTAPVGGPAGQPDYCNAALRLSTGLEPLPLLEALHVIEAEAGRVREVRWAARTLDLDLIMYESAERGCVVQRTPRLALPHPRAWQRGFVLAPLRDLVPALRHPVLGTTASAALRHLDGPAPLGEADWVGKK